MKYLHLTVVVLMLSVAGADAQNVPGYMGKKLLVEAAGQFNGFPIGYELDRMIFSPKFSVSYVVGRHSDMGITYNPYALESEFPSMSDLYFTKESIKVNYTAINLFYNFYKKKGLAPLGPYYHFSIGKIWASPEKSEVTLKNSPLKNYDYWMISAGFFRRDILFGPVFLNYGVQLSVTTAFKYGGVNPFGDTFNHNDRDEYQRNGNALIIYDDLKRINILSIRIGLGILI